MMEWWNDIRMLCARYLVASEQMERSGPVAAAVRAAGYVSEEEESEEEEGSSVEEEMEDDFEDAGETEEPPSYTHPPHHELVDKNGYPVSLHETLQHCLLTWPVIRLTRKRVLISGDVRVRGRWRKHQRVTFHTDTKTGRNQRSRASLRKNFEGFFFRYS